MNMPFNTGLDNWEEDIATCTICGESVDQNEPHVEMLCAACVDAWTRDVEAKW